MDSILSSQEATKAWILGFYAMQDSKTTTDIPKHFMPTASLKFANNPEILGLESITQFFGGVSSMLSSIKHDLLGFDVFDDRIYNKARVTFVVAGDPEKKEIVAQGLTIFHLAPEGKLKGMEVFIDFSAVLARVSELTQTGGL